MPIFFRPAVGVVLGPLQMHCILEACTRWKVFVHRLDGGQHFQGDTRAPCDRQGRCLGRSIRPSLLKEDLSFHLPHGETAKRKLFFSACRSPATQR